MIKKSSLRLSVWVISCLFNVFLIGHGFPAGTLVGTPKGLVPIEQIRENDLIISRNKVTNSFEPKPVVVCGKKTVHQLIKLTVGNAQMLASPEQRFYLFAEKKWVFAKDLKPGQFLLQNRGSYSAITALEKIDRDVETYELSIQDCHNFCASEQEVVAHNFIPELTIAFSLAAESSLVQTAMVTTFDCIWAVCATKAITDATVGPPVLDAFFAAVGENIKNGWSSATSWLPWVSVAPAVPEGSKRDKSRDITNFDINAKDALVILDLRLSGQVISGGGITYVDETGKITPEGREEFIRVYKHLPEDMIASSPRVVYTLPAENKTDGVNALLPVAEKKTDSARAGDNAESKTRPAGKASEQKTEKKQTATACAGGAAPNPNDPNDRRNLHEKNNPNDKSGPKVKPPNDPKYEKLLPQEKAFEPARNKGFDSLKNVDSHSAVPYVCMCGPNTGKIVGMGWNDKKAHMRLDWHETKGAHINVRNELAEQKVKLAIPFEGSKETVDVLVDRLNTPINLEIASDRLALNESRYSNEIDEFCKRYPQLRYKFKRYSETKVTQPTTSEAKSSTDAFLGMDGVGAISCTVEKPKNIETVEKAVAGGEEKCANFENSTKRFFIDSNASRERDRITRELIDSSNHSADRIMNPFATSNNLFKNPSNSFTGSGNGFGKPNHGFGNPFGGFTRGPGHGMGNNFNFWK